MQLAMSTQKRMLRMRSLRMALSMLTVLRSSSSNMGKKTFSKTMSLRPLPLQP